MALKNVNAVLSPELLFCLGRFYSAKKAGLGWNTELLEVSLDESGRNI